MHVIATAGHVDHGKSTLVRALTGMEPDRWAEERRRGMTIDLGFAWTALPSGEVVAFVDVSGHERFVPNMLAGVGPAPAALVAVAADEGWMPQSAEHLAALDALGVRHGLLVVTRTDLADPGGAAARARAEIAATSLGRVETVPVGAATGDGPDALRAALDRLVARLPAPDAAAPVRLWVDRSFTIRGSGTVVTGTLGAGQASLGDELELAGTGRTVRVRGMQALGESVPSVTAVARVALNLRGVDRQQLRRGDALLTPGRFEVTDLIDVRLHGDPVTALPATVTMHVGRGGRHGPGTPPRRRHGPPAPVAAAAPAHRRPGAPAGPRPAPCRRRRDRARCRTAAAAPPGRRRRPRGDPDRDGRAPGRSRRAAPPRPGTQGRPGPHGRPRHRRTGGRRLAGRPRPVA